jgi:CBS domain-containing protein
MKVSDKMTRSPRIASPDDAIRDAAGAMAQVDTGVLPVGENDRLVGMVTDRDIAVRAVAQGKGPDTKVREVMTRTCSTASRTRISTKSRAAWPSSRCAACR